MTQYDFTLRFTLGNPDADPGGYVDRLYEAGCSDALVGIGKPGQIALDFSREAKSAALAIISAIGDVKRAIPEATFIEAAPDFVDVPDIADVLGVTRQYVRKIVLQNKADFPPAVFNDKRSIWHLDIVLHYIVDRKVRRVDDALLELARTNRMFNHAVEKRQLPEVPAVYLQAIG